MTGSTAAFACWTTWRTTCCAAGPATAPSSGDCRPDSLSATASTSFLSSSAAEPAGGPYWARRRAFSASRSSAQAVAQASASGGPAVVRASVVRSSVAAGGSAAGAGRASPSGRLASAARASFTASPQASSDGGSRSLMTGLLTTDGPSDGTRPGVAASPGRRPERGIGPEPDAQLALAQRRAVPGAAAQRGGEGGAAAERSGGDGDLVAAPDQVQLLAPGPRQGDVPDQDAVVGGGGPPARAEPGVGDAGDGPVDGGRGRAGARQGERAQVVGAARVPSEVGDGVDGVRLTPFGERLALLGDGPGQPAVLDVLGQHPAGDEA